MRATDVLSMLLHGSHRIDDTWNGRFTAKIMVGGCQAPLEAPDVSSLGS